MTKAKRSLGTKLKIGAASTAIPVGGVTSIDGIENSADTIDVTTLDSDGGYRDFIAGFKDAGDVSLEGFLYTEDAGQVKLSELFKSGEISDFSIVFPEEMGAQWDFKGVVTGFGTSASMEEAITFTSSIKVSGEPILTLSA